MPKKTSTNFPAALTILFLISTGSLYASEDVAIRYDRSDSRMEFAAGDLRRAIHDAGSRVVESGADRTIVFDTFALGMGGLELAEMIALGGGLDAVVEKARKPTIFRRGLKFNIPFDGRAPSYDDTGTAAQENIAVMWEWEFWEAFLDCLARNRYNVLTLWTNLPIRASSTWKHIPAYRTTMYADCANRSPQAPAAISMTRISWIRQMWK
jgi:hypothetical protein